MIKMILAVDRGNAIGRANGDLPWKVPNDMKRFAALTAGSTVVMGHNTFKSLGRIDGLPGRRNVVISQNPLGVRAHCGDDVEVTNTLDWVVAHQECLGCTSPDIWIIGGAQLYTAALDRGIVDEIYLTLIDVDSGAEVTMGKYDFSAWKLFVLDQQKRGIQWDITQLAPVSLIGQPCHTFITLEKLK